MKDYNKAGGPSTTNQSGAPIPGADNDPNVSAPDKHGNSKSQGKTRPNPKKGK